MAETYVPKKPCLRGHWLRYKSNWQCIECQVVRNKEWNEKNPERRRAIRFAWDQRHPEQRLEISRVGSREYGRRNPEKIFLKSQRWIKAHPELTAGQRERRNNRLTEGVSDFTNEQWSQKLEEFGGRCAYCKRALPQSRDHVIPISKGGFHTASNIVPACKPCNSAKGTKSLAEFLGSTWLAQRCQTL